MKVLFVDDEPHILEGLERMLFDLDKWEITCVDSGPAALTELAVASYDVIVADMRMPGMDGAALLREVHGRYPEVVRIVLSGHSELEAAVRAVPVAHQFLSKPCQAEVLQEAVERACGLRELLTAEAVRRTVGSVDALPSVPRLYAQLTQALSNPDVDAREVADIISQDPAMCAKVLQLVNSAFFSRAARISDIRQAVPRLGFQMVKNLALSVEVFRPPKNMRRLKGFSIEQLQRHSLCAATLAGGMFADRAQSADAFMAAMLHDLGKLILAAELPDRLEAALSLASSENLPLHEAEQRLMAVSHAEIGAYLLGLWGLPYPIVEAVANHHHPERVPRRTGFGLLEAVYTANCLANGAEPDAAFLEQCGVADRVDDWRINAAAIQGN